MQANQRSLHHRATLSRLPADDRHRSLADSNARKPMALKDFNGFFPELKVCLDQPLKPLERSVKRENLKTGIGLKELKSFHNIENVRLDERPGIHWI
jgi:hypothetical protein